MTTVAALFVETDGCYFDLPGVQPWDIARAAADLAEAMAGIARQALRPDRGLQ